MYIKDSHKLWLATGDKAIYLEPSMANRHGLIAGATGTGKTVMAKSLSRSLSCAFSRVQFTPDLLPADIDSKHQV